MISITPLFKRMSILVAVSAFIGNPLQAAGNVNLAHAKHFNGKDSPGKKGFRCPSKPKISKLTYINSESDILDNQEIVLQEINDVIFKDTIIAKGIKHAENSAEFTITQHGVYTVSWIVNSNVKIFDEGILVAFFLKINDGESKILSQESIFQDQLAVQTSGTMILELNPGDQIKLQAAANIELEDDRWVLTQRSFSIMQNIELP